MASKRKSKPAKKRKPRPAATRPSDTPNPLYGIPFDEAVSRLFGMPPPPKKPPDKP